MKKTSSLPPCGLYKTGVALRDEPEYVPAGILIQFHDTSDRDMPFVQLPKKNVANTWSFEESGPGVENDPEFLENLKPLKEQGFYYLKEHLHTPDGILETNTLVQLGYNKDAEPILFPAYRKDDENSLKFKEVGYCFEEIEILSHLMPETPFPFLWEEETEEYKMDLLKGDPTGTFQ